MYRSLSVSSVLVAALSVVMHPQELTAHATVASFLDDFEGTLSQWAANRSGYITTDPLDASNHVLSFASLGSGGDIFSANQVRTATHYTLSFDYLGMMGTEGDYGGGFVGVDGPDETWLFGDASFPALLFGNLVNDGTWNHYEAQFTPAQVGGPLTIKLEDYEGIGPSVNNAFFDNVSVIGTSASPFVTVTAVGTPVFDITSTLLFAAPTDIFPTLVPNHFPRSVHAPPYGQEFADGLAMKGITEAHEFSVSDFTDTSAVHLAYVIEPKETAPTGSSPDYADGPVIPNPIIITGDVFLNDAPYELMAFDLTPSPAPGIDGASHYVVENWENSAFAPPGLESLVGDYEYRLTLRDTVNDNGYDVVARFSVVPEPDSCTLVAVGAIVVACVGRRRK